ncbi:hypothetical protein SCP_1900470 [Sparassis crispa]|uniref:Uncharacterized protein n=1 Tax=Sparassis crispa TaxID=139825 RepID=A0A401H6W9_9APHY|nr:hypothetical protein SCP_1900470 [Sparassis crispa]GBE90198.1 hypothetical protein SCP_1900470 [Sparassis crispa]
MTPRKQPNPVRTWTPTRGAPPASARGADLAQVVVCAMQLRYLQILETYLPLVDAFAIRACLSCWRSYPLEVLLTFDAQPVAGAAALVARSTETLHVLQLAWCPLGAFANLTWLAIHTLQMCRPADMGVLGVFPMLRTLTL